MRALIALFTLALLSGIALSAPQAPTPAQAPPCKKVGPTRPAPAGDGWQWTEEKGGYWWRWKQPQTPSVSRAAGCPGDDCPCGCNEGGPCVCAPDGTQFTGCSSCGSGGQAQGRRGFFRRPAVQQQTFVPQASYQPYPVSYQSYPTYQPYPVSYQSVYNCTTGTCTPASTWTTSWQPAQAAPVWYQPAYSTPSYHVIQGGGCPGGNCSSSR
jgi:hypothetical protein